VLEPPEEAGRRFEPAVSFVVVVMPVRGLAGERAVDRFMQPDGRHKQQPEAAEISPARTIGPKRRPSRSPATTATTAIGNASNASRNMCSK
jgi:hypothetical protein